MDARSFINGINTMKVEVGREKLISVFFIVVIAVFSARAQIMFNPLYAIDTYSYTENSNEAYWYNIMFEQGRYGYAVLWWIGGGLDFGRFDNAVYSYVVSTLLMVVSGMLLSKLVFRRVAKLHSLSFTLIFCLHPFMSELFHFANATLMISIAIFVSSVGLSLAYVISDLRLRCITGAVLVAFALAIYQTVLGYVLVSCLMSLMNVFCQEEDPLQYKYFRVGLGCLFVTILGTVIYFISIALANHLLGIHISDRFNPKSFFDVQAKINAVFQALNLSIWPRSQYITGAEDAILLGCLGISIIGIALKAFRNTGLIGLTAVIVIIALCLVISTSITIVSRDVWLVPRTLSGFSVFSAAVIASGLFYLNKEGCICLGVGLTVLISSYIGAANRAIHDQVLANRWDSAQANRIVERLEQNSGFNDVRSLALIGGDWARTIHLSSVWGDMNISAFAASWAKIGIIEQATGIKFDTPSASEAEIANKYCKNNDIWPAKDSTKVQGSLGIVCLTRPL